MNKSLCLLLLAIAPLLTQCASTKKRTSDAPVVAKAPAADSKETAVKTVAGPVDDLDEYAVVEISDPLERLNRATFWVNDKMYLVIFRPLSKGYEKVLPRAVRKGIDNAFENARFPVRVVNNALQGKFRRVGQETEKFLLNTIAGVGGIFRVSEKVPTLAALRETDTGMTFAVWGMGHGAYIVIPFLGPSSLRDGVGLIGDYALNPVNWGYFSPGKHDWTMIPPSANTLRALPSQLSAYEEGKRDAIDPYIAIRSAYVQYRADAAQK